MGCVKAYYWEIASLLGLESPDKYDEFDAFMSSARIVGEVVTWIDNDERIRIEPLPATHDEIMASAGIAR